MRIVLGAVSSDEDSVELSKSLEDSYLRGFGFCFFLEIGGTTFLALFLFFGVASTPDVSRLSVASALSAPALAFE